MSIIPNNYHTYDLGLASVLSVLTFELIEMDRSNPKKIQFIFKPDRKKGDIEKIAGDYFNNTLELPVLGFFNAVKMLKNRIYSNY